MVEPGRHSTVTSRMPCLLVSQPWRSVTNSLSAAKRSLRSSTSGLGQAGVIDVSHCACRLALYDAKGNEKPPASRLR
jgi:hypothetical protein